jgi:hypothetical protein
MTISMPSNKFTSASFYLETNTQTFTSPINRNIQRLNLGGSRWRASYSLPALNRLQWINWRAFFLQLDGMTNDFYGYDVDCKYNLGSWGGTPLVKGASQTGSSLLIDGCPNNITNYAMAGDYFTVNGELKQITANANSNGSGEVTLSFKPMLRNSPADNAAITFNPSMCRMILTSDTMTQWECDKNGIYSPKTFDAMEVF